MAKLKVFKTPAGFHDAYVAAPSQKAALAAWGSTANLFARGLAEVVTDPALTRDPLAHPGEVIRVARTSADAPDPPEVMDDTTVDVGALAEEMFVLAIDPYPRAPGAELPADGGDQPQSEDESPFAVLREVMRTRK